MLNYAKQQCPVCRSLKRCIDETKYLPTSVDVPYKIVRSQCVECGSVFDLDFCYGYSSIPPLNYWIPAAPLQTNETDKPKTDLNAPPKALSDIDELLLGIYLKHEGKKGWAKIAAVATGMTANNCRVRVSRLKKKQSEEVTIE